MLIAEAFLVTKLSRKTLGWQVAACRLLPRMKQYFLKRTAISVFFSSIILLLMYSQQAISKEEPEAKTLQAEAPKTAALKMPEALRTAGFVKFADMIQAAGLTEALENDGPFTCFAPTDEAVKAVPEETAKKLASDPKGEFAISWIKYHFLKGDALKHQHLMNMPGAKGYSNQDLILWVTNGKISINREGELTRFDIEAANGVIHETNKTLDAADEARVFQKKPANE